MERRLEDNLEYRIPIHGLVKAFNEDTSSEFKSFLVTEHSAIVIRKISLVIILFILKKY